MIDDHPSRLAKMYGSLVGRSNNKLPSIRELLSLLDDVDIKKRSVAVLILAYHYSANTSVDVALLETVPILRSIERICLESKHDGIRRPAIHLLGLIGRRLSSPDIRITLQGIADDRDGTQAARFAALVALEQWPEGHDDAGDKKGGRFF